MVCKLKKAIYVTASDKLKQAPRAKKGAWFKKFSSFLTASFLIKGSTVAVRILPCLFVDVMVVASSFFYTLTTTFSPGILFLFNSISSRSLATHFICLFHPLHYFLGMEVSRSTSGLHLIVEEGRCIEYKLSLAPLACSCSSIRDGAGSSHT